MKKVDIPIQPYLEVNNEKINYRFEENFVSRYFIRRIDGKVTELNKQNYNRYKDNPYFEKVIIKWYIRGTEEFVRSSNEKELDKAEQKIRGIKNLIVNPLQLYQGV